MVYREVAGPYSVDIRATSYYFKREFQLSYQPVISLENDGLYSLETFVCWQPDRAALYSSNFYTLIKQSQLDISFHHWLLYEACQQMQFWQINCLADIPLFLSINLSSTQLLYPYLIEFVKQTLDEIRLAPAYLQLEIPAKWIVRNWKQAKSIITRLQRTGVSICIDDFELSRAFSRYLLYNLPIDTLKVDAVHASQGDDSVSEKLIEETIAIAHEKSIQVIPKGLETAAQLAPAKALGCVYGQGCLLSRPLASRQATSLIATHVKQQQKDLLIYLTAMHALSQFAQRFLGRLLVAKYWQETKPNIAWLALIEPYTDQSLTMESAKYFKLDMGQQQDLLHWTHQFVQRCNNIIRGFSGLLTQADISLPEKRLLRV